MAHSRFPRCNRFIIDIRQMRPQLCNLRLCDGKAKLALRIRELHPEPAPGGKARIRREQALHAFRRIAGTKRAFITIFHGNLPLAQDDCIPGRAHGYIRDRRAQRIFNITHIIARRGRQVAELTRIADVAAPTGQIFHYRLCL